jgi:cytochrome P450
VLDATDLLVEDIDLSDPVFWDQTADDRERAYRVLRREAPVRHFRQPVSKVLPGTEADGNGYWAATTYEDIVTVSRDPETYCSGQGIGFDDVPPEILAMVNSFLVMDDPEHKRLRGLVRTAFHPRQVRRVEEQIASRAATIVDELIERGDCDFVEAVAARLPMGTLWDMWGVPADDRPQLVAAAEKLVGYEDPDVLQGRPPAEVLLEGVSYLREYAAAYAEERRARPGEDLMTGLVQAHLDGSSLTDDEISGFVVLLAVAGLDTTRHTTSHAMKALTDAPDQRRVLQADLAGGIDTAVEEFVRWATPVMTFRRTATRDTTLNGQSIAEGAKVVLFYASGNRDETVFEDADRLDVLRSPNKHLGFGGGGPHFCLGNQLARAQLRALFTELLTRVPDLQTGQPEFLNSSFIHGVVRMPCVIGTPA